MNINTPTIIAMLQKHDAIVQKNIIVRLDK
jgi:hypothetical protein